MWRRISHPNIIPFLGFSEVPAPLSMVSEWMPNGNVREYVGENPGISRLQLVCEIGDWVEFELTRVQLLDISRGLSFLHTLEIVHGDLKGVCLGLFPCHALVNSIHHLPPQDNILVDELGFARLGDFGLTSIASLSCTVTSAPRFRGSHRWMAPELFNIDTEGGSGLSTRESDVFALGMVTFEVRNVSTGSSPYVLKLLYIPSGVHWTSAVLGVRDFGDGDEKYRRG